MVEECTHGNHSYLESQNDLGNEFRCQQFCALYHADGRKCSFFTYNREDDFCELYEYDVKEYINSCVKKGMTETPSFDKCLDFDEPCAVSTYLPNI